jgi:murein DD-endopeptidase MepM/ murein hydrolase activator NlpD
MLLLITKNLKARRLNILIIGLTVITCLICYDLYKPNAYEVFLNGRSIAYVEDKDKIKAINDEILGEISGRFANTKINNNISYDNIIIHKSAVSSDSIIRQNILNVMDVMVNAVEMNIDGKSIGLLGSEKEGEEVINRIANDYLQKITLEDKKIISINNKIKYIPKEVQMSSVNTIEDITAGIRALNNNSNVSFLNIQISGKKVEEIPVNYSSLIKWSDTMAKGQSQVTQKGENGLKEVEKEVIFTNGKVVQEKVIKEKLINKAKDEIIVKGLKTDAISTAAMIVPSRGSISSNFGVRWGKMHEGIDIAAPMNTPIYAAMDGKVIYSDWETGYGKVIKIAHSNNIETIYGHCNSLNTKKNQNVKKGDLIGYVGSTGNSTGPHLHFEVRISGKPVDPSPYIYKQKQG